MFCPLDCWDACELELKEKFKGVGLTPYLCYKLNNYFKFPTADFAKFNGKNIMLNEALDKLIKILNSIEPKKVLFIKGSGNMGIMQNITKLFFEKYGATFAIGSTCDGIGEKGIRYTRNKSLILPSWIIKSAKKILIWGRNPYVTNTHLLPLIKNKKLFTIDVRKTKTFKNSDYFLEVKPNSDYFLAVLLIKKAFEKNYIKRRDGKDFDKFKELIYKYDEDFCLEKVGIDKKTVEELFDFIKDGAVVLTGLGVAKCKECYKTTAMIDNLFFLLDFFGKNDRGVAFLGSSNYGLFNPFNINHKNKIALFDVNLDDFDVVFIQGANPLISFVNRSEWDKLKQKTTIVFGKYYDESAKISTLFIPTKDFYEKIDIRGSYFDEYVRVFQKSKVKSEKLKISEYELTKFLFEKFNFGKIKKEEEYIDEILKKSDLEKISNNLYKKRVFNKPPYENLNFNFFYEGFERKKEFEIVTVKYDKALNSQFKREENLYINPKSKNIMLSFLEENFNKNLIKYNETLQKDIIFSYGGVTINKVLKSKGENAYYSIEN